MVILCIYNNKSFYSFTPNFVVSTKCIDPWVIEFVVSKTLKAIINGKIVFRVIFYFHGFSGPRNQRKLEPRD
jgi:hypothetical protein